MSLFSMAMLGLTVSNNLLSENYYQISYDLIYDGDMYFSEPQVKALIKYLQKAIDSGELK